ncbi:hypothetical protein RJ639_042310 [Escallonia herrerae]|uniref:Integrase catalytic domain-containing protein n=1 Tax=Escallonia herrerae TaxID=1293975 RepID=A0AA88WDS1_9ASTE|nr:hypothetical protein RJ639_042310 [Escallonia herrerae]
MAVDPPSTHHSHLDPSDLRLRLTSRSSYGPNTDQQPIRHSILRRRAENTQLGADHATVMIHQPKTVPTPLSNRLLELRPLEDLSTERGRLSFVTPGRLSLDIILQNDLPRAKNLDICYPRPSRRQAYLPIFECLNVTSTTELEIRENMFTSLKQTCYSSRSLKRAIEGLIKRGQLRKFVAHKEGQQQTPPAMEEREYREENAALNRIQAVVSTYHLKMKFPTEHGIREVKGDQTAARHYYMASCRSKNKEALIIEDLRENTKMQRGKPVEELVSIKVYPREENKTVQIGSNLKEDTKLELVNLLRAYADVFAWTVADMPGIDLEADTLSRLVSTEVTDVQRSVYLEFLKDRSISSQTEIGMIDQEPCWMDMIVKYLSTCELPSERHEARNLGVKAARYPLVDRVLYKKSFSLPYLRCLRPSESLYELQEVHEGICGQHLGGRTLAQKILRQGYYWPVIQKDAIEFARRCDKCQKFSPVTHTPVAPLTLVVSPIPFAIWGMDLLGSFPMASGQRRFMIVAIDYFTIWTEAESLATITSAKCEDFFWKNVVCRFGVPRALVVNNGKQFDNNNFQTFCTNLLIDLRFTSVAHTQSNSQTENMNRSILQGLKKKLDEAKGAWVDELPKVLWAYRTTPH